MFRAMARVTRSLPADAPLDAVLRGQARAERASWASGIRAGLPWGPRYGHAPLPAEADRDAAWRAVAPEVDLLIGTTRDETAMYLPALPVIAPLLRVPVLGRGLRAILTRAVVRPTTRRVYARPVRAFAARHRAAGGRAVRYVLRAAPASSPIGAGHTSDVPLILGTREAWTRMRLVPPEAWPEVAARGLAVRQVWADFARTGEVAADADARAWDALRPRLSACRRATVRPRPGASRGSVELHPPRPRPAVAQRVVRVEQPARLHRQAAAADAARELALQSLDAPAPLLQQALPAAGCALPVGVARRPVEGHVVEGGLHVGERDPEALGHRDQRHPTEHVPGVAALVARGALGGDEAEVLVEAEGGRGDARAAGHLADREQLAGRVPRRRRSDRRLLRIRHDVPSRLTSRVREVLTWTPCA